MALRRRTGCGQWLMAAAMSAILVVTLVVERKYVNIGRGSVAMVSVNGEQLMRDYAFKHMLSLDEASKVKHAVFECEGEGPAHICLDATAACIKKAEDSLRKLYATNPKAGTETRPDTVCKCFENNGCKVACNVAMYVLWSTESNIQCPAKPPQYNPSMGKFRYGDMDDTYVVPSDLSYDYFPQYPNPSGYRYVGPVPTYEEDMPKFTTPHWHWSWWDWPWSSQSYYHPSGYSSSDSYPSSDYYPSPYYSSNYWYPQYYTDYNYGYPEDYNPSGSYQYDPVTHWLY